MLGNLSNSNRSVKTQVNPWHCNIPARPCHQMFKNRYNMVRKWNKSKATVKICESIIFKLKINIFKCT